MARGLRLDRGGDAFDALAVARIGHALAAAAVASVRQLRHDDGRLGLGAAADGETARDRPAFDRDRQRKGQAIIPS